VSLNWLGVFAEGGWFVDVAASPFDDMVSGPWGVGQVGGKQLAVPLGIFPAGLWYRADLLANAGVESDQAMEDTEAAMIRKVEGLTP
jgi:ABC-type glycerol-3-phosphate transport system substrate-binding protein